MNYNDILKDLKAKKYRKIYLLQGEESYFIDQLASYMEEHILSNAQKSFNQMTFYGKDTDVETVVTTARRYPMMSPYQVVIVKEAHELKDINKLEVYAKQPSPTTILILVHKYKTIKGTTKTAKAIAKNGVVFTSKKLYQNQVPAWIQRYLKDKKRQIQSDAVQLLTEYLGNDLSKVSNELDKLLLNIDAQTVINKQHVADNIGISKDYNVFEFQKAIAQKNTVLAMKMANYFAANPKSAPLIMIIGSLYRFVSRLYVYQHLKGKNENDILKAMSLKNRYALKDYQEAVKHYNKLQVKNMIDLLYHYDLKSKGIGNPSTSSEELLKEMTYRLIYG